MQNAFDKRKEELKEFSDALDRLDIRKKDEVVQKQAPDDLMTKCPKCDRFLVKEELLDNLKVCPYCNNHMRLHAKERIEQIMDKDYEIIFSNLAEKYLDFPDYKEKLEEAKKASGNDESIVCVKGKINGIKVLVGVMDSFFMMGSMGSVCGEKVTLMAELAIKENLPLILFTCSGGARMQEGIISLMQMAKTSQAIGRLKDKGLYISVLTDPTTGGVSASFAALADITLAEPNSLIGFAGKRVIERTIKEVLPKEFQTAEFNLEKGYIDKIVPRKDLKETLATLLKLHGYN